MVVMNCKEKLSVFILISNFLFSIKRSYVTINKPIIVSQRLL
jgi:hypothetical protein